MFRRSNISLASLALCLTVAPSPSAAILKRQRVVTDPTNLAIDEGLFTKWRGDQQKKNRNGIDLDAIERDLEERRWLKSGSYSYSEDSDSNPSTADSFKDSEIDSDTKFYGADSAVDSGTDSDSKSSEDSAGDSAAHSTGNSDSRSPESCKFKGKMYGPGQWIDLGTDKCKCDEEGSTHWVDCEQYEVGSDGEGELPLTTSDFGSGVTVDTRASADSKLDAEEGAVKTETKSLLATVTVGCPSVGVVTTNNLVVDFAYMVKTKPASNVDIQAIERKFQETSEKIKRNIFDSLASEIVDCSGESPKMIVAKSKGAGRKLEVMLIDSYPEDQVVGTCIDVKNCFIVQGAITVTYTKNETKETATLYTMNTIKEKMERGEFDNQGNVISVEYIGKLSNIPEVKSTEPIEQENNKSSGVVIVLFICGLLFLTFGSIFVKFCYDMRGSKNEKYQVHHNESFMDEDSDTVLDLCLEDLP